MNRQLVSLVLCLLLLGSCIPFTQALSYRVHDEAGLMTSEENSELETIAEDISSTTGLDLVILTVGSLGGQSPSAYADDYYDSNGHTDDGMLFMLAMEERDWYISTSGEAMRIFDDDAIDQLLAAGLPRFSEGYYHEGFREVLREVEQIARTEPHSRTANTVAPTARTTSVSTNAGKLVLISILIGVAVSGIIILIMRGSMNTKRKQRSAGDYLTPGSYHLRTRQDIFLYSNVTKTPRQQSTSSTHGSSSGRSHGGGGTKF